MYNPYKNILLYNNSVMHPELKLLKLKQKIFTNLIEYENSKNPKNFLLWYQPTGESKYKNLQNALDSGEDLQLMEYISKMSEKDLNDLHDFISYEVMSKVNLYNKLIQFNKSGCPDLFFKSYLTTKIADEYGRVNIDLDIMTFLNMLRALNSQDNIIVIAFITHMSQENIYFITDFFR